MDGNSFAGSRQGKDKVCQTGALLILGDSKSKLKHRCLWSWITHFSVVFII